MKARFLAIAASALLMAACGGGDADDAPPADTTSIAPVQTPMDSGAMAAPMDSAAMPAPADSVPFDSAGGDSVPEGKSGTP